MQIRHTRPEDLPAMQEIFADARAFMRENGNPDQCRSKSLSNC